MATFAGFGTPAPTSQPTPAFGAAPASTGFNFGFGAAPATSTPGFFNATTAPAFSIPGTSSTPQATPTLFPSTSTTNTAVVPFSFNQQQQQPQQQQQQQQQQQAAPNQPSPATKYEDLPPNVQQVLNGIQELISDADSKARQVRAMQASTAAAAAGADQAALAGEARQLRAALAALQGGVAGDADALADFKAQAVRLLQACEQVVRTFARSWAWRNGGKAPGSQAQMPAEALNAPVLLPNPFLEEALAGFRDNVEQYRKIVGELEQSLALRGGGLAGAGGRSVVQGLPVLLGNLTDYLMHVAAKLEKVHSEVTKLKDSYLATRPAYDDPFERLRRQREQQLAAGNPFGPQANGSSGHGGGGLLMGPGGYGGGAGGGAGGGSVAALAAPGTPGLGLAPSMSPAPSLTPFGAPGAAPGASPFGSPFPGATPGGGFGAPANNLARTGSKTGGPRSKARR